jgi:ComF family protein
MLRTAFFGLLDLLAPPVCAACGEPSGERSQAFCTACDLLVDPAPRRLAEDDVHRAACVYGGPVAEAMTRLKYGGESWIAPLLAAYMKPLVLPWLARLDGVVCVPISARRLRTRGYNQSALLAAPLARAYGLAFRPQWLARRHDLGRQVGRSKAERLQGVQGAFRGSPRVAGLTLLVVDDVCTTGATLEEARRALLEAGARAVLSVVLASAPDL